MTFIVEINKFFNYSGIIKLTYCISNIKLAMKIKKIRRMRIFGARIFFKSFGGKIQNFQTGSNEMENLKKKRRMRILNARIFSKSFGQN